MKTRTGPKRPIAWIPMMLALGGLAFLACGRRDLLTVADWCLILVVTGLTVGMAYVYSPRAKSLLFSLPLPFSAALFSTGRGIDATHVAGLLTVWAFVWLVWLLHSRLGVPILAADGLALAFYCAASYVLPTVLPESAPAERLAYRALMAILATAAAGLLFLPRIAESGHRSSLPVYIKTPLILLIVTAVVMAKEHMRGFVTTFPFVTVFAVYEARHSLYTLARRMAIFMLGMVALLMVTRWLIPAWGMGPALGVGWCAFLSVLFAADALDQARGAPQQGGDGKTAARAATAPVQPAGLL